MTINGKLMNAALDIDSLAICEEIKVRINKINKKHTILPKLTLTRIMRESANSMSAYCTWRTGTRNPSKPSLERIDQVLSDYEHGIRY